MAKQSFTTGSVLTATQMNNLQANDYNQTVNQKTASYVLVATDAGTRIEMNAAGSTTVTVNTGVFAAGDTLFIQNIGAGTCTVTAGTATVQKATNASLALTQYQGGYLYFISTGNAVFFADAGFTSPLTTKGDLFTWDTANQRLAVGANATVLTADSTTATGLKWAAPAAPTYVGVSAYKSTTQNIANATYTAVTFDTELFDTDNIHSNSTNTSRFTVPSGKAGKWLLTASLGFTANTTGIRGLAIYKNGSAEQYQAQLSTSSAANFICTGAYVGNYAVGDYIELFAYQSSGGNLDIAGLINNTAAQWSYLGA